MLDQGDAFRIPDVEGPGPLTRSHRTVQPYAAVDDLALCHRDIVKGVQRGAPLLAGTGLFGQGATSWRELHAGAASYRAVVLSVRRWPRS